MIKLNNALLEVFLQHKLVESRVSVHFFKGTIPTKAELNAFISPDKVKSLSEWNMFMFNERPDDVFLAELISEGTLNSNFRTVEDIVLPVAGDPSELVITRADTPDYFILHVCADNVGVNQMERDGWSSGSSYYPELTVIGTTGTVDSGADIEIIDGEFVDGNSYKLNNILLNLAEQ